MNLIELAASKGLHLCTAESLTAGQIASEIAKNPGASRVFLGSIVAYSDSTKSNLLTIPADLIASQTAVSPEVASAMSKNCAALFAKANAVSLNRTIAIATTGVAGPDRVDSKPVGLVYISVSSARGTRCEEYSFAGTRGEIVQSSIQAAIQMLWEELEAI